MSCGLALLCLTAQADDYETLKAESIHNPMLWADVPDPDVIRVGDTFYLVSTTMHLMPGAPVMASKDLKNWETVGYIFDKLTDSPKYDLQQGTAYGRGQWATSLKYHNGKFYALLAPNEQGAMGDTYIFSAEKAEGPWTIVSRMRHFHDCSLFFDDDNRVYVIYGTGEMMELKPDLSDVIEGTYQKIFQREEDEKGLLEGSRVIKHNGKYYLLMISHTYAPGRHRREVCYRADDIHGPYEKQVILESEFGGFSYEAQGTIVDTQDGDWYGIIFQDRGGVGRVLTVMPCRWINGWPMLGDENGKVPDTVRPLLSEQPAAAIVKSDEFSDAKLGLHWQWNHNPIDAAWSLTERPGFLRLKTNRVVNTLYLAPNTLTQRMEGPACSGAIVMDCSKMKDGDCAGLAAFNSDTGALTIRKQGKKLVLEMNEQKVELSDKEKEVTNFEEKAIERIELKQSKIWLRIDADFRPQTEHKGFMPGTDLATFYYSLDGEQWTKIGSDYKLGFDWRRFFMGTKFGIFCYATKKQGGYVDIDEFKYTKQHPFQNPALSNQERVENLLSLLTPEEKVGLMMNKSASIDRLGIPSYNWWNEACHGVRQGGYTVYPQPIGMAAAFNAQLVYDVFSQVSDEARANWNRSDHNIFNVPMGEIYYPGNPELTYWCPNVNIFRDPRWGRGQETCGEDPYLNAVLGVQTVLGMQGNDSRYFKTHACAKHYAVHSGPEPLRHSMNVEPTNRDLWETYLPAFKALVKKGNVREVMCAYQRFEGKPCCTSDRLLIDILRNKWGYEGIVVTDCDAINNFYNKGQHETHTDPLSASVDAVLNGTDLECGKVFMSLTEGLKKGYIQEADLDGHLRKTLMGRFELGMFDPADMLPWAKLGPEVISSEQNDALAVQAARESMVLLENRGVLPLSKQIKTIAVVGPNADDAELLNGNYGGTPTEAHTHTLLEGIKALVPEAKVIYRKACELNDDYNTVHHLGDFNGGKGVKVEFYNNRELSGEPAKTDYYKELNFSTFGAWGFAQGVSRDDLSVRISGQYQATFTGEMKYTLMTDNGYVLKVNGEVVEDAKPGNMRGFFRRTVEYKSFTVEAGKTYDVVIEYKHGDGQFALLRGDICERILVDYSDQAKEVSTADAIVIIGGISAQMEGEGGDKETIELPNVQQRLIRAMHDTGRPVVFVNCSGSAIAFGSVEGQYDALLQAWYPGQGGSKALAEVLFGDYNPGGKLPVTFYRSNDDLPDFLDYSMKNRTYRYFTGEPQYAFGYGLSYTSFAVGKATLSAQSMKKDGQVTLTVPVTNTGKCEGTETIQVYVKALDDAGAPIKALKGFQKLTIRPGESQTATITLDGEAFEYYDESIDELSPRAGRYQILYGTSSLDKDLQTINFTVI